MSRVVQSSLILVTSVAITALVMAVVFPVHALGGAAQQSAFDDIRPAVFVEGTCEGSGTPGSQPACPFLAQRGSADACPYLSAIAAGCGCPYLAGEGSHVARQGNSPDELSL